MRAAVVPLTQHHMRPVERTAELMGDLFELPMVDATVVAAIAEAQARLAPTVEEIGRALAKRHRRLAPTKPAFGGRTNGTGCLCW